MRSHLFVLLLLVTGCGSVRLGGEEPEDEPSAVAERDAERDAQRDAATGPLDAGLGAPELQVVVTVSVVDAGCASCVELTAAGALGTPPYSFEWEDGTQGARRQVCAPVAQDAFTVTVRDALGRRSPPHAVALDLDPTACVDASAPLLCLSNPSFEGRPAFNSGAPVRFDAPPWSDCTQPSRFNAPEVVNDTILQFFIDIPAPTDGKTFLGLREGHQASQALCAPIRGGEQRSFRIDARKLDISNATFDTSEGVFLSVWGGFSANCAVNEALWFSPKLSTEWQNFCITITPRQYMDQLTLLAFSDASQPTVVFLIADHLVPVASCP